jgi:hypothetical protein
MPLKAAKEKLLRMIEAYEKSVDREIAASSRPGFIAEELVEFPDGHSWERRAFHREIMRQMALVLALMPDS